MLLFHNSPSLSHELITPPPQHTPASIPTPLHTQQERREPVTNGSFSSLVHNYAVCKQNKVRLSFTFISTYRLVITAFDKRSRLCYKLRCV